MYSIEDLSYISVTAWPFLVGAFIFAVLLKTLDKLNGDGQEKKSTNKLIKYGCSIFFLVFLISSVVRVNEFSSNLKLFRADEYKTASGTLEILTPKQTTRRFNNFSVNSLKINNTVLHVINREDEVGCLMGIDIPFESDGEYVEVAYKERGHKEPQCILAIAKLKEPE